MLALLTWVLGTRWQRRWIRAGSAALACVAWAAMTPLVANALVGLIERRADPGDDQCHEVDALVLLSGGLDRPPRSANDYAALTGSSSARLFGLLERLPEPTLPVIISGGGPFAHAEAELLASLLKRFAPSLTPILESRSMNTWDNAFEVAKLLPPPRHIALASSAMHLPRARLAFMAAGFSVCRWPLDRRSLAVGGIGALVPQSSSLRKTEAALHELAGEVYYRWRARK